MPNLSICLAFNDQAEQAVSFYASIFKDLKIISKTVAGRNERGGSNGTVRTLLFEMLGREFLAVNGGPHFRFNDGVSLVVDCQTQGEIDELWEKLSLGGVPVQCGWLTDRFGLSWQIVPQMMTEMMADEDPKKSQRVMQAVLKMKKIDILALQKAYNNEK